MLTSGIARQEILELTGAAASGGGQSDDLEQPPLAAGTCFDFHQVFPWAEKIMTIEPCAFSHPHLHGAFGLDSTTGCLMEGQRRR